MSVKSKGVSWNKPDILARSKNDLCTSPDGRVEEIETAEERCRVARRSALLGVAAIFLVA